MDLGIKQTIHEGIEIGMRKAFNDPKITDALCQFLFEIDREEYTQPVKESK